MTATRSAAAHLRLRPGEPSDHQRIADIIVRGRAAFMSYAPSAHPEGEVRAWVQRRLLPAGGVTVATLDAAVVGVLAVSRGAGYGWIEQMYVDPPLVGRAIGSALLAHALAVLPPPIRLYTFQANAGARRFYERNGFRAIAFTDGRGNEEEVPDVLYERAHPGIERIVVGAPMPADPGNA